MTLSAFSESDTATNAVTGTVTDPLGTIQYPVGLAVQ